MSLFPFSVTIAHRVPLCSSVFDETINLNAEGKYYILLKSQKGMSDNLIS